VPATRHLKFRHPKRPPRHTSGDPMKATHARIGALFDTLLTFTIGASSASIVFAIAIGA
jgi:hypothetical protein